MNMKMSRRIFFKEGAVISAIAVAIHRGFYTFSAGDLGTSSTVDPLVRASVEESIKASFGSGFEVLEYYQGGGLTRAKIEHLENLYLVQSPDLVLWKINSCSVS